MSFKYFQQIANKLEYLIHNDLFMTKFINISSC